MNKWYAVPGYKGAKGFEAHPHVVNSAGELVATCERIEDAESIARDHVAESSDLPELSEGLPPLPDGAVYLGRGGSFTRREGKFDGWACAGPSDRWDWGRWMGSDHFLFAAPEGSKIVRLNRRKS